METAASSWGKARTFGPIPSPQPSPSKRLSLLPRWFYKVTFCLLSKGLAHSQSASAFFSSCLPHPCLPLALTAAELARAAAHPPATAPENSSAPFQGRGAASAHCARELSQLFLCHGKRRSHCKTTHVCSTVTFTGSQVQRQLIQEGQIPRAVYCQEGSTVFEILLDEISSS